VKSQVGMFLDENGEEPIRHEEADDWSDQDAAERG
jgi:hypothetical protein